MTRPSDGTIIAMRSDRLGSRMAAILNAMRVAETYGRDYRFIWPKGGHVSAELRNPEDIFDMAYFKAHVVDDADLRPVMRGMVDLSLPNAKISQDALTGDPAPGAYKCTAYTPLVLPWEDADATCAHLAQMFAKIGFNDVIVQAMAAIAEQMTGGACAFHIRRGDIIDDHIISNRLWSDKYIPRAFYQRYLEAYVIPAGKTAFIFSDTQAEVAWFKANYPQARGIGDLMPEGLTLAQRDCLELYAMSLCDTVLGPPDSAYSIAAAAISDIPIQDVRDALDASDLHAAHEVLVAALEAGPDQFHGLGDAGQTLAIALTHLDATHQPARVTALMHQYLEAGLDKVYFYGIAAKRLAVAGDFKACRKAFAKAQQAVPVRMFPARVAAFWGDMHYSAAFASIGDDDDQGVAFHLAQGVWNEGNGPTARLLTDLVHLGAVEADSFVFPVDPALRAPPSSDTVRARHNPALLAAVGMDPALLVWQAPDDQLGRDWQPFMFTCRLAEPGLGGRRLRRHFAPHCPAHVIDSALGTYLAAAGDPSAIGIHQKALRHAPDNPLYLKRLGDALVVGDDPVAALHAFDRAAGLAPDVTLYQATLIRHLAAHDDLETAAARMTALCESGAVIPAIPQMAVTLRRSAGLLDDDLADLMAQALRLAPSHRPLSYLNAQVLADLGRWADAQDGFDALLLHYGEGGDLTALGRRIAAQE